MRHSPSPPNLSATGSHSQEALGLRYLLLTNEKGIRGAAGGRCCSSEATNPILDVYQAISHKCHCGSVSAEHPRCRKTCTLQAMTDAWKWPRCAREAWRHSCFQPGAALKTSSDKVKQTPGDGVVLLDSVLRPAIMKYDN